MVNIFNVSDTIFFYFLSKTETRSKSYSDPNVIHATSSDEKTSYGLISGPLFSPRKKMDCFETQNAEETDSGKYFSLFCRFPKTLIDSLILVYMSPGKASLDFGVFFFYRCPVCSSIFVLQHTA